MDEQNMQPSGGNSSTKWIISVIVIVLAVWAVVAAQKNEKNKMAGNSTGQNQTQTQNVESYQIGVILPLTGDAAAYGEIMKNAEQIAFDEINAGNGINGKKLEVIYEDGKCNGQDATNAMQKLVNVDKVQAVIGGFCSSESIAASAVANTSKVVLVSGGSSSPKLTNISHFFFRDYPSDSSQGKVLADVSYNKQGFKKVAFLQEQQDYALGIYQAFTDAFQKMGGTTVKEEYPKDATDFRTQLVKLRSEKPDALFLDTQTPAASQRILKQLQELKWTPKLLLSDQNAGDLKFMTDNKSALEGALVAEFTVDQNNPKFTQLDQAYKQKYGKEMDFKSYTPSVYDAVYIIRDGIAQVGYDGQKLADWSRTIKDWQGASGKVTIGEDGDLIGGHRAEIIKDGKTVPFQQ